MEDTKLIAKKRDLEGSSNARRMRGEGQLPGVVYGSDKTPVSVTIGLHDFEQVLHHHTSESLIIDIDLEGEGNTQVLVKDVQHHPVTSDLLHVDFMRVEANKPIQVSVALEPIGESAGVKAGGILDQVMHAIDVECLPADLVEKFEIDVAALEIGDSLSVADLSLGAKFKILVDEESIVVSVAGPMAEEEPEEEGAEPVAGEPEVIGEKTEEETSD